MESLDYEPKFISKAGRHRSYSMECADDLASCTYSYSRHLYKTIVPHGIPGDFDSLWLPTHGENIELRPLSITCATSAEYSIRMVAACDYEMTVKGSAVASVADPSGCAV